MSRSTRLDRLSMSTSLSQSTLARISQQRRMKQTPGSGEEPLQYRVDLLSVARHELKTPLTVLKMQIQLLQRKVERQNADTFADIVARIETQVDKLERLSRDLLDISSIQAPEYTREIIDLDALLSESREVMQQLYPTHTILVQGTPGVHLIGDKNRLGQVFNNLLSNAIKYSPMADTVELDIATSADTVTICVRDYGIGIPSGQQEKIFERFYRAVEPRTKAIRGLGVGLYIVEEIVRYHGGTITVESEIGKGSTFQISLPLN